MFLSLDIVGSTEFKQSVRGADQIGKADSWVAPFLSFYQISVEHMAAQWDQVIKDINAVEPITHSHRFEFGEGPTFWKGAGDEVLFSKVIKSPLDALASIHALLEVMKEHRKQFSSKPQTRRLNVKGAAWLAGFPINNAEIILAARSQLDTAGYLDDPVAENYRLLDAHEARDTANLYLADYIGPSVDLGFRLREHATPRRLIVSADLAWLLCFGHREIAASEQGKSKYSRMPHIGYDGRHGLKGILGGEPYPLIWIESDVGNAIDKAEDRLLRRDHPDETGPVLHSVDPLWEFCAAFLTGQGPLRMCPYIPDYPAIEVGTITAEHRKRLQEIEEIVNGPATQLASIDQSDNGSGTIPKEASEFAYLVLNDSESPAGGAKATLPSKGKLTRSRKSSS